MKNIITSLLIFALSILPLSSFAKFKDVPDTHPYSDAIEFLSWGAISGYPDGTYKPDSTINRAEFIKILISSRVLDSASCTDQAFPDVPKNTWFAAFICSAKINNWISGYPDGSFRPAEDISFVEAAKIIAKINQVADNTDPNTFWYQPFVEELLEKGAIPFSITSPDQKITRGEMAEIMYQLDGNRREQMYSLETKSTKEEKETFEIDIEFPQLNWHRVPPSEKEKAIISGFQAEVAKIIAAEIASFQDLDVEEIFGETKNSLYIRYEPVFHGGDQIVSIRFNISTYTGGAHPNSHTVSLNYDLNEMRVITLEDLFLPGAEYLDALSTTTNEAVNNYFKWLGEDPDTDWIKTGTEADILSFTNFNIRPTGIEIVFDPYFVGPYAAGSIKVLIPYSHPKIKAILDDQGPAVTIKKDPSE